jgi:hypothetical protein
MKIIRSIILIFAIIFFASSVEARKSSKADYFLRPQVGIWFGPITPVYTTYDDVDTNLGGGMFFRYNTLMSTLKIGVESSYQYFESQGVNTLSMWPVFGNLVYRIPIPIKVPLTFQLKAGAGGCWVKIRPDRVNQWDPMGMLGFEFSFPAGRIVNIGLRIDYLLIYEQHLEGATKNGHILNTGISLFFNFI